MKTATDRPAKGPITSSILMGQIRSAIDENPEGVSAAAWMKVHTVANTEHAAGMLIVCFRLLAMLRLSRAEVLQMAEDLKQLIEKVGDSGLYTIFYRGMSMILRPRRIKLPERRFEILGGINRWHEPL